MVLFNFTNLTKTPFTKSQVQDSLTNSSTSAKRFFEEESKGRMTVSGAVFGWYTIDAATTGCNWGSWRTLAENAANADGANLASYTNVMFVFPNTSACGWAGLGYVPGNITYLNGNISVQVMTHELGHNFGLGHSNADNCVVNGTRVMIAAPTDCDQRQLRGSVLHHGQQRAPPQPRVAPGRARLADVVGEGDRRSRQHLHHHAVLRRRRPQAGPRAARATAASSTSTLG